MALLSVSGLYLLILVWAACGYLRRRDPLLRDVMLIFACVGMLFLLAVVQLVLTQPPRLVVAVFAVLLLGQPFFTLRLVSRLRRVPRWMMWSAAAGWAASSVPVVMHERPLPPAVVRPVVALFFAVEAAAAWLLAREARRRGGAARVRLGFAAAGTALFGTALLVSGSGHATAVGARPLAVISALIYLLAFLPPRWLRRTWSWGAAYALTRRLLAAPPGEPAHQTWQVYCEATRDVLGADDVVVLLSGPGGTVTRVTSAGSFSAGDHRTADIEQLLSSGTTVDAHTAGIGTPPLVVTLTGITGTRFVSAVPLVAGRQRGALVLLSNYRMLFADDDLTLFAELAGQAAILAQRSDVHAERQRLAQIVESSHDAIIGKTVDGIITSWNGGAQRLYGYPSGDAIGRHARMLLPAGQQNTEDQLMARVARGEHIDRDNLTHQRQDGTTITVSLNLSPITDANGRTVGVASIAHDISERQRAESMFRGLLEAAPDAIVGVTEDGLITLINAQAERLFGYHRAELLGQPVEILVPERQRGGHPQHREHYFAHPKARPMGAGMALAAVRKDGTQFPAEISLSALETDHGTIVSAAIRDVTERLEAQAERERLAAQAERDATERRAQHTRRLESLGQLAGGVAHDFNNILAVIANYAELITDTLDTTTPSPDDVTAARNDLTQISRAAERATQLTKQLLAFGRRDITQAAVIDLNHVITDVEQMLRRSIGEHIHLMTRLDPAIPPVFADPSQIEQILVNLAVNARDAMPTGGTLSIETADTDLDADDVAGSPLKPGKHARVRISDTGTGMSAEIAERAFEPFYTTKPPGAGTGLGLATAYGIAAAAGGHIRLYSEPGFGTTFTILLPATDTPASTDTPDTDPTAGQRPTTPPGETILLVEDEQALREATSRILARAGYHVLTAAGGDQAIHLARTYPEPLHLLLTDVIMPEMLGNEVAARIQQLCPGIPVLYMSGYAQPVLAEHGTLPPGVTMIEKPFTRRDLLDRVHAVLHHATATNHPIAPMS